MAHAVQLSAKAWAELAITHANWHRKRNAQRLNAIVTKRTFKQHDKVAVFVPPTAAEAAKRGRKVKHLVGTEGPVPLQR